MTVPTLMLTPEQKRRIEAEGEVAFPHECCGILYGTDGSPRVVDEVEPVRNDFDPAETRRRFSIPTADLIRAERKCGPGRVVLGFYHSHPDHPARPSDHDRSHAWPFYSYVIVSIFSGKAADMTSWMLDETAEAFVTQRIEAAPRTGLTL